MSIFKGKSKLRILVDMKCDLSGYVSVTLMAKKPDGTIVSFPMVVKDVENGIAFFDVRTEDDFNASGWWTFWPEIVFDDDRTACGEAVERFIHEPGR